MFDDFLDDDLFDTATTDEYLDEVTYVDIDMDGDGYSETLNINLDLDGDGEIDVVQSLTDVNYDGYTDVYGEHAEIDTDGDGLIDTAVNDYDTNGDGLTDVSETLIDTDGDGVYDTHSSHTDVDNDGIFDNYQEVNYIDRDGDGIVDTVTYANDIGNDGYVDFVSTVVDLNQDGIVDLTITDNMYPNTYSGVLYNQNFNPDNQDIDWDDITGDPAGDMEHWHQQTHDDTCAVVSQEFVLEELLGIEFHEEELREIAMENGWYSDGGGTPAQYVGNLLEIYGLEVDKTDNATIEDIENCLDNGGSVIVGLDADEIWSQGRDSIEDDLINDPFYAPGKDANHAVEVIGIDSTDSNNVMVILNDPGSPNGCGSMIPLDEFMDAWEDSDNLLVTAYK